MEPERAGGVELLPAPARPLDHVVHEVRLRRGRFGAVGLRAHGGGREGLAFDMFLANVKSRAVCAYLATRGAVRPRSSSENRGLRRRV